MISSRHVIDPSEKNLGTIALSLGRLLGSKLYWKSAKERRDMPEFEVDREPIHVFQIDDSYLFKHYFARNDLFSELGDFYNRDKYRFEVPDKEFSEVQELLEKNYFDLQIVDEPEEFCVVKEEYTDHSEILRNSVLTWNRDGYNFFLMKDPIAVDQATEQGATHIEATDLVLGI